MIAAAAAAAAAGLATGTAYLRCASLVGLDAAAPMKPRRAAAKYGARLLPLASDGHAARALCGGIVHAERVP